MENAATTAESVPHLHEKHEVSSVAFESLVILLALAETALLVAVWGGWLWLILPLVLVAGFATHALTVTL